MTDVTKPVQTDMTKMTSFSHNPDQPEKRKGKAYVKFVNSDVLVAEMQIVSEGGEEQGIFVPRGVQYWFEKGGDEPLHLLRVAARTKDFGDKPRRINHRPNLYSPKDPRP